MADPQIQMLPLNKVKPDPNNPRGEIGDITELATSVKAHGILQPILVRKSGKNFIIVAGERRFKAALAVATDVNKATIPGIVKDVSDEEAFEIQTIENLQREDLPPYGEALAFKNYIDRFGPEYIETLAEKIGCKPSYIRSRTSVFELPKTIVKSWKDGKINFSHINAFLYIKDDKETLNSLFEDAQRGASAKTIMETIKRYSIPLKDVFFDFTECTVCPHNSDKQKTLFGIGYEDSRCNKTDCFAAKTQTALENIYSDPSNKQRKKWGTNGFILATTYDDIRKADSFEKWEKGPFAECKPCEKFVSVFNINGSKLEKPKACLNPDCKRKLSKAGTADERKKAKKETNTVKPTCAWHGKLHRELFYMERIPAKASEIRPDSPQALHTAILALVMAHGLRDQLAKLINTKKTNVTTGPEIMDRLRDIDFDTSLLLLRDLAVHTVMDWDDRKSGFDTSTRDAVAKEFGIDISAEWKPTEAYLQAKRKKDLITWIETLPPEDGKSIKNYIMERSGGRLDSVKKPGIIKAILGCGIDLTGKTPDEIVNYDQNAYVPNNKKPERN